MAGRRLDLSAASFASKGGIARLAEYTGVFLTNALVYPLSAITPRDQSLWAFGAPGGRFEGNAKYLFLWAHEHARNARCVWISESPALAAQLRARGYRAYARWSWQGVVNAARAGVYFFNDNGSDISFGLSAGAKRFNLWHGIGLKNVNRGAKVGYGASLKGRESNPISYIRNMRRFQRSHWILATADGTAEAFFARCFELPKDRAPVLGYPRMDPMISNEMKTLSLSFEDYSSIDTLSAGFKRRILYAPTLRISDKNLLQDAIPDVKHLSKALRAQDAVLMLKLHPKTQLQEGWSENLPKNICILPEDMDIYPVLDRFDALITDYSSLFFDYIFFRDRGMLLYPFDYDRYVVQDRDLAWDYEEATIGVRVGTFGAFCDAIEDGRVFSPMDKTKLAKLRHWFWDGEPSTESAAQRIVQYAEQQVVA